MGEDTSANLEQYNESIKQYQDAYNEKLLQDQHLGQEIGDLKNRMQELQQAYEGKVEQKKAVLETIMRNQKASKRFSKAAREQTVQLTQPAETLQLELEKARTQTDNIMNTVHKLQNDLPELAERLQRVIPVDVGLT